MVVNLQKEVLEMDQWLRRKRRICANDRQSLEVCCCERRNGSVFSVFKYDRTSLYVPKTKRFPQEMRPGLN
jgi:hypothetical protein